MANPTSAGKFLDKKFIEICCDWNICVCLFLMSVWRLCFAISQPVIGSQPSHPKCEWKTAGLRLSSLPVHFLREFPLDQFQKSMQESIGFSFSKVIREMKSALKNLIEIIFSVVMAYSCVKANILHRGVWHRWRQKLICARLPMGF